MSPRARPDTRRTPGPGHARLRDDARVRALVRRLVAVSKDAPGQGPEVQAQCVRWTGRNSPGPSSGGWWPRGRTSSGTMAGARLDAAQRSAPVLKVAQHLLRTCVGEDAPVGRSAQLPRLAVDAEVLEDSEVAKDFFPDVGEGVVAQLLQPFRSRHCLHWNGCWRCLHRWRLRRTRGPRRRGTSKGLGREDIHLIEERLHIPQREIRLRHEGECQARAQQPAAPGLETQDASKYTPP